MRRLLLVGLLLGGVACSEASTSGAEGERDAIPDVQEDADIQPDVVAPDGEGDDVHLDAVEDVVEAPTCPFGEACDDGDPCTLGDSCDLVGLCVGTEYSCDDERECTTDTCAGDGTCGHVITADACLIANICRTSGSANPMEPCGVCDPSVSGVEWTPLADGDACDDGTMCITAESCEGGVCQGVPLGCNDGNSCTQDFCDPQLGCEHAWQLAACDDDNACTDYDQCDGTGTCVGLIAVDCVDGEPCTADLCDPRAGCSHPPLQAACSDGDLCTVGDACAAGDCQPGLPNPCSDGNSCTSDACAPALGCVHAPITSPCCVDATSVCEDGDPCTIDSCDPDVFIPGSDVGCIHVADEGPCTDGDACTVLDACVEGSCVGNAKSCDDGNVCTVDACEVGGICVHTPEDDGLACDDGVDCTTPDLCAAGTCIGDATPCTCTPEFPEQAQVVVSLAIGSDGTPGQALDVDGDPTTCSPPTACSDGADNALSVAGSFVNSALASSVAEGSLVVSFAHEGWLAEGGDYTLLAFTGEYVDMECDAALGGCSILVAPETLDEDCQPVMALPATGTPTSVAAGGPGNNLPILFPVGEAVLSLNLYHLRIEATLDVVEGAIVGMQGVMGGAIRKADLFSALEAVPPEQLPAGLDAATLTLLLDGLVISDIDTDGDGQPDAASVGFVFGSAPVLIDGVAP